MTAVHINVAVLALIFKFWWLWAPTCITSKCYHLLPQTSPHCCWETLQVPHMPSEASLTHSPGRTVGKSKRLRADRTLYLAWWGLPASGTAPSPHATRPFSSSTTVTLLDLTPKPASLNSQSLHNFYQLVSVSFCPIPSPIGAKIQFFRPDRGLPSCSTQVPPFKKKKSPPHNCRKVNPLLRR